MRNTCASLVVVTYIWICRCSNRLFAVSVAFSATRTGRPTFLSGFYANTPTASASCSHSQTDSGPSVWKTNKKQRSRIVCVSPTRVSKRYSRKKRLRGQIKNRGQYFQRNNRGATVPCVIFLQIMLYTRVAYVFFAVVCTVNTTRTASKMSIERNISRLKPMFANEFGNISRRFREDIVNGDRTPSVPIFQILTSTHSQSSNRKNTNWGILDLKKISVFHTDCNLT